MMEKFKSHIILISIVLIAVFVVFFKRPTNHAKNTFEVQSNENMGTVKDGIISEEKEISEKIMIDIKGEVKQPGVYEITSQSRVNDVILKAGGFTEQADEQQINLAEIVYDEMVIYIPAIGDALETTVSQTTANKIQVNRATLSELESLTGIGPSKAKAIIKYRDEYGRFETAEDLLNVPGIGQKTLDNIVDELQIP